MLRLRLASQLIMISAMLATGCTTPDKSPEPKEERVGVKPRRNFIIFVADGLRPGSVTKELAPTLTRLREQGVSFRNSHSLYPTFTTANASSIATGHYLGDTGDFANMLYVGYRTFSSGSFSKKPAATMVPFIETDPVLADLDEHFGGNFLSEDSLLSIARAAGYQTAAVGKIGPVLLQDVTQSEGLAKGQAPSATIIIDDATGSADGLPIPPRLQHSLVAAKLGTSAPKRNNGSAPGSSGDNGFLGNLQTPGTTAANVVQQQYFADAVTKSILPLFQSNAAPFGLVYWSRDPDGSQHNQGDSLGTVVPGINGPTSKAAVRNVDANLQQILAYLDAHPDASKNTDLFITSDHGFSTISRHDLGLKGEVVKCSYAQTLIHRDDHGKQNVATGFLPLGFLAIDIAHALALPIFDPEVQVTSGKTTTYKRVDPTLTKASKTVAHHLSAGNALIGGTGKTNGSTDAQVIIAVNGGSDLIYLPGHDAKLAKKIVTFLASQDYVSGLFTDDSLGELPGALPLSAINLVGSGRLPLPSIVVNFRSFATDPSNPAQSQVDICDTALQQGQGMHGGFGRGDTFNTMIAYGPDFKTSFVDHSPASNADVAVTIAHILGLRLPSKGKLSGRVLVEALNGGPNEVAAQTKTLRSRPAEGSGKVTILNRQEVGSTWYFDAGGFAGRTVGLAP